jgi:hypothetical protein
MHKNHSKQKLIVSAFNENIFKILIDILNSKGNVDLGVSPFFVTNYSRPLFISIFNSSQMKNFISLSLVLFFSTSVFGQAPCSNISILDCDQVGVNLPLDLNFNGTDGGILATGFTMVDPPSTPLNSDEAINDPNIPGLISSNLAVSGGALNVTVTNGINFNQLSGSPNSTFTNSQMNALGVGLAATINVIDVTATIAQPNFAGSSNNGGSQQAGIWFGLNENNFAKLVLVKSSATQQKVQLAIEQGDGIGNTTNLSIAELNTSNFNIAGVTSISFRISVDPSDNAVTGFYSLNGGLETQVADATTSLTAPAKFITGVDHDADAGTDALSYAGIMTSTRRATGGSLVISYDSFGVTETNPAFAAFINFQDEATTPPTGYAADFGLGFPASSAIGDWAAAMPMLLWMKNLRVLYFIFKVTILVLGLPNLEGTNFIGKFLCLMVPTM